MKQRWMALLAGICMLCALAGCGDSRAESPPAGTSSGVSSEETSGETAEGALPGVNAENYPLVDGSTANLPLLAEIYSQVCGVALEEAETMVSVSGGTGAVWRNLMNQGADLLVVYEAPEQIQKELEDPQYRDAFEITPFGLDGLVFLVNAQNPVDGLSRQQLIDIYTGTLTDWGEVGGTPGPIAAFQRNEESGSQTLFRKLLMQEVEPMEPPTELRPGMMGELIDAVAEYDGSGGAIGFSVYYYAQQMYTNPNLKLLAVDGVEPTASTIGDGSYPLVNAFYLVLPRDAPGDSPARLLRDWLLTDAGSALLGKAGYVPAQG